MKPVTYFWPFASANSDDICLSQAVPTNNTLEMNGLYGKEWSGFQRQIVIKSTDDLSADTLIVVGSIAGRSTTKILKGPNKTSLTIPDYFDSVTSIKVEDTGIGKNISVGFGDQGATSWFSHSPWIAPNELALVIQNLGNEDFGCTLQGTLSDVFADKAPLVQNIGATLIPVKVTPPSTTYYKDLTFYYSRLFITGNVSFKATFFQPGREQ